MTFSKFDLKWPHSLPIDIDAMALEAFQSCNIRYTFLSNHNNHKSLCGLCSCDSEPLILSLSAHKAIPMSAGCLELHKIRKIERFHRYWRVKFKETYLFYVPIWESLGPKIQSKNVWMSFAL